MEQDCPSPYIKQVIAKNNASAIYRIKTLDTVGNSGTYKQNSKN